MMSPGSGRSSISRNSGRTIEHVIAGKSSCFGEALDHKFEVYAKQVKANAQALPKAMIDNGLILLVEEQDNHLMLIDLRNKM